MNRFMCGLTLIAVVALSACATAPPGHRLDPPSVTRKKQQQEAADADRKVREARLSAATKASIACIYASTDRYAAGPGTPTEIAEATLSDCFREMSAYRAAIESVNYTVYQTVADVAVATESRYRDTVGTLRQDVIARVLRARTPKN